MTSNLPPMRGLTAAEVAERVKRRETNTFKARVGRTYWQILRDNVLSLFNIVLGTLLLVVLLFQDYSTVFFAGFSLVTNSILGFFQEIFAKRKLDRLAALSARDIPVWRDGQLTAVPIAEIVKDDVIPIQPGDRLVVDGRLLESHALEIDESQLTGESDAVFKEAGDEMYSGSFCIAGTGVMVATRVGRNSSINQLSSIAKAYKNVKTPSQQRIAALVEITVVIMLVVVPVIFIASYLQGLTLLEILRNEVVFVSSIVPQGLVLTAILSLTLGAISISRYQTLVQRVNAVESMANVTVLCFDKTGTLTRNQLAVAQMITLSNHAPDMVHERLRHYMAGLSHLNRTAAAVAQYLGEAQSNLNGSGALLREVPFNATRKWGAVVFEHETLIVGAPERVLGESHAEALQMAQQLSADGLRVLAFARTSAPPDNGQISGEREALALIALSDQVRSDIRETLDAFRSQRIALKIISGDNLDTVKAIAAASGMKVTQAYTGDALKAMSPREFETAVIEGNLFARIEPDVKRRIIAALKRQGAYVAMVGDGVNDVPALKEAHLAIAMNDGAQITKDVADLVLLNNAVSTLPRALDSGRRITQVIYGTTRLFLVKNFYTVALIFLVSAMMLPFPTSPSQISWITFGTVNLPAGLISFQLFMPAFMAQFRRDVLDYVILAGGVGAAMLALLYAAVYFDAGMSVPTARSAVMLFIGLYGILVFWHGQGISLLRASSFIRHWRIVALGLVLGAVTLIMPFVTPQFFDFVAPSPLVWALIIAIFTLTAVLLEVLLRYRRLINQLWLLLRP